MLNKSGSALQWSQQPEPKPQTWKLWQKAMRALYTHSSTTALHQPLGTWMPTHSHHWQWTWLWGPQIKALYQHQNQWWYKYELQSSTIWQLSYNPTKIVMHLPQQHLVPVTPQTNPIPTKYNLHSQFLTYPLQPCHQLQLQTPIKISLLT